MHKQSQRTRNETCFTNASIMPSSARMSTALYREDLLCRIFGRRLAGELLNREVGGVPEQGIPTLANLFTYARYSVELSRAGRRRRPPDQP
jgi:hypothetical protein